MKYQKEKLTSQIVKFAISIILFLVILFMCIHSSFHFVFVIILLYMGLVTWANWKSLQTIKDEYKRIKENNPLDNLVEIDKYQSIAEMRKALKEQLNIKLYEDEELIITQDFLVEKDRLSDPYLINGILDVKPFGSKVNGVFEYVSLIILYYDGNKYELRYNKVFGNKEKLDELVEVANIVANISKNYKKASL